MKLLNSTGARRCVRGGGGGGGGWTAILCPMLLPEKMNEIFNGRFKCVYVSLISKFLLRFLWNLLKYSKLKTTIKFEFVLENFAVSFSFYIISKCFGQSTAIPESIFFQICANLISKFAKELRSNGQHRWLWQHCLLGFWQTRVQNCLPAHGLFTQI